MKTKTKAGPPLTSQRFGHGIGVSAGIAIGAAHVVEPALGAVPEYRIASGQIDKELVRFRASAQAARAQIGKLRRKARDLPSEAGDDLLLLLDAHRGMIESERLIQGVENRIRERAINAEAAVQDWVHDLAATFAAMTDPYLAARAEDVHEVGRRILLQLTDRKHVAFTSVPPGCVVVAEELSPADTALMDPSVIAGFVTALGGADSHTAIMARSLGLPAVLGLVDMVPTIRSGDQIILDGEAGEVIVHPDAQTLADYRRRIEARQRLERQLRRLRGMPAITRDKIRVTLQANLDLPREVEVARRAGAEGVGLVRTEFLFMNRPDLPSEDEQYNALRRIVEASQGYPVTVRTIDVGGEKLATSLGDRIAAGANPALGLRAIRLALREPALLETQLAAILRAGAHGPVRILLPMISVASEIRAVRRIMAKVVRRLRRRQIAIGDPLPEVGVMIEVPGAALAADSLARESEFFAIGTNDLTMYTLAIDRGDEQVADLYDPLHPGVLRLIQLTVDAANRRGIDVSVCGEMAGNPRHATLLVGMGLRQLSMTPNSLPRVKQRIRQLDGAAAARRAQTILDQYDPERVSALLDEFIEAL
ncbi:MAG: phosphoenolpyruvate--protein phosphotransferase [Alphaproteobacteria bacterium]|nr:phosphoenolpyruvate--protein phosphotransferase [Alphaproteobacteria bacterium]